MTNRPTFPAFRLLFNLYLWLSRFGECHNFRNQVFDSYGSIDTMGNRGDRTRFTSSYSDEFCSVFRVHLPFYYCIQLCDEGANSKTVTLGKLPEYLLTTNE